MRRPFLALGFSLAVVLGIDQSVRLFLPPESKVEGLPWYLPFVQYDPLLGWSGHPNAVEENDGISIQTYSIGDCDREPGEAEDGRMLRVLFLGDSFTWGDEVRRKERFTSLLEASCGTHCARFPPIHAINKGVIGYGTAQSFLQYLLTRREHPSEIVILGLFTGNDLSDNAVVESHTGPRPRLSPCDSGMDSQELCLEGVPVPPVLDWPAHRWLNPRSTVARTLGRSGTIALATRRRAPQFLNQRRVSAQLGDSLERLPFRSVERTSEEDIEDRIGLLELILRALDRTIREDGKRFGVLVFPSDAVYRGDGNEGLRDYRDILGVLGRLEIPFVDYFEQTRDLHWDDLFFGVHSHWRPSGHQAAAQLLRPLLVELHDGGMVTAGVRAP